MRTACIPGELVESPSCWKAPESFQHPVLFYTVAINHLSQTLRIADFRLTLTCTET